VVAAQGAIFQRAFFVASLAQVGLVEGVGVDDDGAARFSSRRLALSAAGFMATSTCGESPGVRMSRLEKFTWKPLTPARVPAGARISAGSRAWC
jgi:hypothetical protein